MPRGSHRFDPWSMFHHSVWSSFMLNTQLHLRYNRVYLTFLVYGLLSYKAAELHCDIASVLRQGGNTAEKPERNESINQSNVSSDSHRTVWSHNETLIFLFVLRQQSSIAHIHFSRPGWSPAVFLEPLPFAWLQCYKKLLNYGWQFLPWWIQEPAERQMLYQATQTHANPGLLLIIKHVNDAGQF